MIDRRTIALINGEVDGVNGPEERETLRQILVHDPEARRLLEDLEKLERNLSSVASVPPPGALKQSIMRSIREHRTPARRPARSFNLIDWLFPARFLPRLGFAFGGGVLAGILLVIVYLTVAAPPSFDARDASGTLFGTSTEALQPLETAPIAQEWAEGRVVTEYAGTTGVVNMDLALKPGTIARLVYNPTATRLKGVTLGESFPGTLTQREGFLEVADGGGTFTAFFDLEGASGGSVRVQILSDGKVLFERPFLLRKSS